ncbi:outer membrane lipoprotein-sorting protein [Sporosarcina koreensis]|uniref:Sigma-E factor regulatory protein RseB domain-containing protein n=1 Tax=Sporosarcina koreensis TaxID=334735 RepID=A0ABW0TRV2_9BACL
MRNDEKRLSEFIDRLNAERKPDALSEENGELEELYSTAKLVRSLKEPEMPDSDFEERLIGSVSEHWRKKAPRKRTKRHLMFGLAGIAAAVIFLFTVLLPMSRPSIVEAMEKAYSELSAYHGLIDVISTNKEGTSSTQAKLEVWADQDGRYVVKGIEGFQKGVTTVNDGENKWQVDSVNEEIHLLPAFPDSYRFTFELGNEIKEISNALTTSVIGKETVAGRKSTVIEVTPKAGESYKVWVDDETKLPLKKQTAWQNAIQYTIQYSSIDIVDEIPGDVLAYNVPKGYVVVEGKPEIVVSDWHEAELAAGFTPTVLPYPFEKIAVSVNEKVINTTYRINDGGTIVLSQGKASGPLNPALSAVTGTVNGQPAEIQFPVLVETGLLGTGPYGTMTDISSIRWQQDGFEFVISGNASRDDLEVFAEKVAGGTVEIPTSDMESGKSPEVEVPYDIVVVENTQKSVDAGNSPWNLDPVFVSQVFASLQLSPEGIVGDYPIDYEDLKVVEQSNADAVVQVNSEKSAIGRVYLKRLVRKDSTGIWTVVGYDLKK